MDSMEELNVTKRIQSSISCAAGMCSLCAIESLVVNGTVS